MADTPRQSNPATPFTGRLADPAYLQELVDEGDALAEATWPRDPDLSFEEELEFRDNADRTLGLWWVTEPARKRLWATLPTEDLIDLASDVARWMRDREQEPAEYAHPDLGLSQSDFLPGRLQAWSQSGRNPGEFHRLMSPVIQREGTDPLDSLIESGTAWANRAPEDEPSIIPGVLIAGGLGVVSGPPKAGKSWLLYALGLAVANDVPLFGLHPVARPGRVLFVLTEGNHARTRGRFQSLARGLGLDPDEAFARIDFVWRKHVRLDDVEVLTALRARASSYTLIVIDLTRHVWRGKSTDDSEVEGYLSGLREVTALGPTIINSLHTSKAPAEGNSQRTDGERILGSQLWFGGADSLIYINKPKGSQVSRVTFEGRDDLSHPAMLMTLPDQLVDGREPTTLNYRPADGQTAGTAGLRDEVTRRVGETPGLNKTTMATLVGARKADVLAAIELLCNAGTIYYDPAKHGLFPASFPQIQERLGTKEPSGGGTRSHPLRGERGTAPGTPPVAALPNPPTWLAPASTQQVAPATATALGEL